MLRAYAETASASRNFTLSYQCWRDHEEIYRALAKQGWLMTPQGEDLIRSVPLISAQIGAARKKSKSAPTYDFVGVSAEQMGLAPGVSCIEVHYQGVLTYRFKEMHPQHAIDLCLNHRERFRAGRFVFVTPPLLSSMPRKESRFMVYDSDDGRPTIDVCIHHRDQVYPPETRYIFGR